MAPKQDKQDVVADLQGFHKKPLIKSANFIALAISIPDFGALIINGILFSRNKSEHLIPYFGASQ